jgi:hypothetical protein
MADQFSKNVITIHEAREGSGRQPFSIPTAEEIEKAKAIEEDFPEWFATAWKLIEEPKALIQSIDEPFTPAAKAAAASRATSVTEQQRTEAGEEQMKAKEREAKAQAAGRTERAKAAGKVAKKKQDFLVPKYNDLEHDLVEMVNKNSYDFFLFRQLAISTGDAMVRDLKSRAMAAFMSGYTSLNQNTRHQAEASMKSRGKIESRVEFYVNRLMRDTVNAVDRQNIADLSKSDRIQRVKAVFDSFRFRNRFMEDVEIRKAHNLGFLEAAKDKGFTKWKIVAPVDSCEICKNASAQSQSLDVSFELEEIPPLHPNARAEIEVLEEE